MTVRPYRHMKVSEFEKIMKEKYKIASDAHECIKITTATLEIIHDDLKTMLPNDSKVFQFFLYMIISFNQYEFTPEDEKDYHERKT